MKDKDWIKKFETLHGKHSKVFSGMGLLKDYECELKLAEDTPEFFYRPSLVPVHLQDRATERLNEYVRLGLFEWVPQGTPIKYSSSLLVIEEKDKVRLLGDYRHVNKFIRLINLLMPKLGAKIIHFCQNMHFHQVLFDFIDFNRGGSF